MENFLDHYTLLKSSEKLSNKYVKSPVGKQCRFCGLQYPEVSFDTLPHVVPELFGKNTTSSNNECDSCNSAFQKNESDMATMVQHYLALLNIKSKRGVPSFRSKKEGESLATSMIRRPEGLSIKSGITLLISNMIIRISPLP